MEDGLVNRLDALCDSYELEIYIMGEIIAGILELHSKVPASSRSSVSLCKRCRIPYPCDTVRIFQKNMEMDYDDLPE